MHSEPPKLRAIAERALEMIAKENVVGLGTGRAAATFIAALGERVRAGLRVRGIPTSRDAAHLAGQAGIPLTSFEETDSIDITVDGADEVDPQCNLIKGYGGALVREKIVAAASRRVVILVGAEKVVSVLGQRGILPVEVVPFSLVPCRRRLLALGFASEPRMHDGRVFLSDNGNYIVDCRIPPLDKPVDIEQAIRAIPGVVGTGLFLGLTSTVLIEKDEVVEVRQAPV
jgi:ribose 5-phosphate isomerase A